MKYETDRRTNKNDARGYVCGTDTNPDGKVWILFRQGHGYIL